MTTNLEIRVNQNADKQYHLEIWLTTAEHDDDCYIIKTNVPTWEALLERIPYELMRHYISIIGSIRHDG